MNLVQINEHLKDMPIQALMSYANGSNPMIPAYMATGELKRREVMQQKSAQSQQAQQGMPTVKDQVEQQAGLMALQAQQQKQAQEQMMQQAQAQPMPVPPEVPQPSMQEEEEPAYAYGGIAKLPVRSDMYEFNSGGIIAFKEGDKVPVVEETEEEKKRRIQRLLTQGLPSTQGIAPPETKPPVAAKEDVPAGLPTLMPEPPKPALRPGEAEIPGLYDTQAQDIVKQRLTPRTLKEIAESQAEAEKLAGVTGRYGEDQMKRYGEEDAQYQQMLKDRNFNRMLAVLSGMGQGGLGGAAPAYLQTQSAEQSADIAQKRRMNELYGNVEAKQREEALAKAKGITTPYEAGYIQAGDLAGKMASTRMSSQTEFAKEALNNKNALDRLDIQYKRDLEAAKTRFANDQELRKIENDYALKRDEINKKAQIDLENYRRTAPTDEQRNFESYLARWKKVPANKNKPETDAFTQYFSDRLGGQFKSEKADITGLNQLLISYQKQLEDITLPEPEKARIRAAIVRTQKDLENAIGREKSNSGTGQPPPGFEVDK